MRKCIERKFNILLIPLLLKVPILAKGVSGARERSQVSGDHEEPGEEIRHPGAAEGGERGRHGGWRQRDQERHLRLQVWDDRDYEGLRDEHPGCLRRIRWVLLNCLYSGETHFPQDLEERKIVRRREDWWRASTLRQAAVEDPAGRTVTFRLNFQERDDLLNFKQYEASSDSLKWHPQQFYPFEKIKFNKVSLEQVACFNPTALMLRLIWAEGLRGLASRELQNLSPVKMSTSSRKRKTIKAWEMGGRSQLSFPRKKMNHQNKSKSREKW